jgi:hypothetical protein
LRKKKRINFQNLLIHLLTGKCKNRQIRSNKTFFWNWNSSLSWAGDLFDKEIKCIDPNGLAYGEANPKCELCVELQKQLRISIRKTDNDSSFDLGGNFIDHDTPKTRQIKMLDKQIIEEEEAGRIYIQKLLMHLVHDECKNRQVCDDGTYFWTWKQTFIWGWDKIYRETPESFADCSEVGTISPNALFYADADPKCKDCVELQKQARLNNIQLSGCFDKEGNLVE